MASFKHTFTSGQTVTPARLNDARDVFDIVNADISATAAIAGTKISPDFGSQTIVSTRIERIGAGPLGFVAFRNNSNLNSFYEARTNAGGVFFGNIDGETFAVGSSSSGTGNFLRAAPNLVTFLTGDTERMRVTSAGNVGIANTSPTEKLHVTGNIKLSGFVDADTSFRGQASDSAAAPSYTWTGDTNTGMFRPAADTLAFSEGGSERMRIDSDGNVLIGTTSDITIGSTTTAGFSFKTDTNALHGSRSGGAALNLQRTTSNGEVALFFRQTTGVGNISVTTTATAFNTSSDYRLKQNVEPMVGGLAKLAALAPKTFEFKAEPDVKVDGFIAHEVQAVVPQAVTGEKDGNEMQGLDHSKLVPVLVAAVQELSAKVAALEAA
jgi:hypothetical protein